VEGDKKGSVSGFMPMRTERGVGWSSAWWSEMGGGPVTAAGCNIHAIGGRQ
jgi:hypothetical protein